MRLRLSFGEVLLPELAQLTTEAMALTNFILTVAGVTAAVVLLRSDVKKSVTIFRRNVRHIRQWLEDDSASAFTTAVKSSPKELESQIPQKDIPKEGKP